MMNERADMAVEFGLSGCSCSQSILRAFGGEFGLDESMALRLGSTLSGGLGLMAGTCGAVSASALILGLRYGETEPGDKERRQDACARTRQLASEFAVRRGSTICREIVAPQGVKLPEEWELFMSRELPRTFCAGVIRDAAEILETLLRA